MEERKFVISYYPLDQLEQVWATSLVGGPDVGKWSPLRAGLLHE